MKEDKAEAVKTDESELIDLGVASDETKGGFFGGYDGGAGLRWN